MVETLLDGTHQFFNDKENLNPTMLKVITKDIQILQKSLPAGIWVKSFENRMVNMFISYKNNYNQKIFRKPYN